MVCHPKQGVEAVSRGVRLTKDDLSLKAGLGETSNAKKILPRSVLMKIGGSAGSAVYLVKKVPASDLPPQSVCLGGNCKSCWFKLMLENVT